MSGMTAPEVVAALARRFCRPEFFFISEATIEGRRFDGLAIGCYATHGWPIKGFEVKVGRGDWLAELADPAKSERLYARCDEWYIVGPEGVVEADEVPGPWGWIRVGARGCRVMKAAPKHGPAKVDREMLLRMLFKRDEWWVEESGRRLREQGAVFAERIAHAEARARAVPEVDGAPEELARLQNAVREFEGASGIAIGAYHDMTKIGRAALMVRDLIRRGGYAHEAVKCRAREVVEAADELEAEIGRSVAALKAVGA